jgi:outer membrane receptor protein involved in Fe transport
VAPVEVLNDFGQPNKFKGFASGAYSLGGVTGAVRVNRVGSYENSLAQPAQKVSAWTTADLYLGYDAGHTGNTIFRNLRAMLSVVNLTNRQPPHIDLSSLALLPGQNLPPYDPVNANPFGRTISIQLSKLW